MKMKAPDPCKHVTVGNTQSAGSSPQQVLSQRWLMLFQGSMEPPESLHGP